ncbi:hypothetical protein [Aquimarina sp. I32.4]|nr:hypothetical protein [Aquimarina sp. I32.4]
MRGRISKQSKWQGGLADIDQRVFTLSENNINPDKITNDDANTSNLEY